MLAMYQTVLAHQLCKFLYVCSMVQLSMAAQNVLGGPLATCSQPGYALTGFTRDGHCTDLGDDDAGSHHICIKMKSDFCTVTGQPDWCGEKMTCMGQDGVCPIGNWCVCQWAFAGYIKEAGGCDAIVDIVCDATNMAALKAYRQHQDEPALKEALQCLEQRCKIPPAAPHALRLYEGEFKINDERHEELATSYVSGLGAIVLMIAVSLVLIASVIVAVSWRRSTDRNCLDRSIIPMEPEDA